MSHDRVRSGITLVEMVIAISLLAFAAVVLVTTFQSAGRDLAFTAEHYTAMFVAQKVIEDINQRLQENPHTFTELIQDASGREEPVVGGVSKYFRLLENTRNFSRLLPGEDQPIVAGPLFEQLKGFTVQVSTRLDHPLGTTGRRNLLEVEVIVRWKTREGSPREYRLAQLLEGTDDAVFAEPWRPDVTPETQALLDRGALRALAAMLAPTHPELAAIPPEAIDLAAIRRVCPGAADAALLDFGRALFLVTDVLGIVDATNAVIRPLEQERDTLLPILAKSTKDAADFANCAKFTELQQKIAALYQKKGVAMVQRLLLLIPILPRLRGVLIDPAASLGSRLSLCTPSLVGRLQMAHQAPEIVQLAFSSAERCYLSLTLPPILGTLPRRHEPTILRRALDLQKIATLMLADHDAANHLRDYQRNLRQFRQKYLGAHPNFVAYLDCEAARGRDLATLRRNFAGLTEIFEQVNDLSRTIDAAVKVVPRTFR